MTYFIKHRDYDAETRYNTYPIIYKDTEQARTPMEAIRKYLSIIRDDTETIKHVRRTARKNGATFAVQCTETGRWSYYVEM